MEFYGILKCDVPFDRGKYTHSYDVGYHASVDVGKAPRAVRNNLRLRQLAWPRMVVSPLHFTCVVPHQSAYLSPINLLRPDPAFISPRMTALRRAFAPRVPLAADDRAAPRLAPSRVELFALLLARHSRIPAIIVKGGNGAPFMISPTEVLPRAPGLGTFTCCARGHVMTDSDGVERTIPCDKSKIGGVVFQMVEKRREFLLGSGDLLR